MNNELYTEIVEMIRSGRSASDIAVFASGRVDDEQLKSLWAIPRQNIKNFVNECILTYDLRPPYLDIGCGRRSYRLDIFPESGLGSGFMSLDHYLPVSPEDNLRNPNVLGDAEDLPVSSDGIRTVFCTEVLEHVSDDERVLVEIRRVIRTGGYLILSVPGSGIPKHDKLPYQIDYRRYTSDSIKKLFEKHDFRILSLETRRWQELELNIFAIAQKV